tara:strand:- start:2840 stop:3748 length:909 start_codon:yes stop_codon:yes gene_type:complete
MSKIAQLVIAAIVVLPSLSISPMASAQGPPDISVDCQEQNNINVSMESLRAVVIYCWVENPSSFNEEVEFLYESEYLALTGLSNMYISAGATRLIEVVARASQLQDAGEFSNSITAIVKEANGAPTWPVSPTDTDDFTVIIDDYVECNVYDYPESVGVGVDGDIEFSVTVTCFSNVEVSLDYSFSLHDVGNVATLNPAPIYWPGGFEDQSPDCSLDLVPGLAQFECSFEAHTSSPLLSSIDACVSIFVSAYDPPEFCSNKILLIEPKLIGISSTGAFGYLVPIIIIMAACVSAFFLRRHLRG